MPQGSRPHVDLAAAPIYRGPHSFAQHMRIQSQKNRRFDASWLGNTAAQETPQYHRGGRKLVPRSSGPVRAIDKRK